MNVLLYKVAAAGSPGVDRDAKSGKVPPLSQRRLRWQHTSLRYCLQSFCRTALVLLSLTVGLLAQPSTLPAGYKLVWSDDFSKDPDGLPDPTKWSYEEGYIRNHESQYYTKGRLENARIEYGQLIIEGRKEDYVYDTSADHSSQPARYTSAALETMGKASWTYGRIEVRAKLPAGRGVWPAIWTLGSNISEKGVGWPRCGEIDIMELVGKEPGIVHGTIHYFVNGKHAAKGAQLPIDHPEGAFHVYAAEWNPDRIDLFVDDKKYNSFNIKLADNAGQNPFRKPHYLILNLALGGDWGGPIDDSIFPQRMTVDYVRIYQKQEAP